MRQRIIASIICIIGVVLSFVILVTKPEVTRSTSNLQKPLVEVAYFHKGHYPAIYEGVGQVVPWRQSTLRAEVSGKVQDVSDQFHAGEIVGKDTLLVQLDHQNYQDAVDKNQALLEKSQAQYVIEQGKSAAAKAGIDTVHDVTGVRPKDVALMQRLPQLKQARADVNMAQLALDIAKRNLEKTQIKSPIHGMLVSTNVHVGSMVDPSTDIAQLIDVEKYSIQLQLPSEIYDFFQPEGGTVQAVIETQMKETFAGIVARTLRHLDSKSRMAQVVVDVQDPLELKKPEKERSGLIIEDFVNVRLIGHPLSDVVRIPRKLMHTGNVVWIYDHGVLRIQKVEVLYIDAHFVYLSDGIKPSDSVITTPIVAPVDGLAIDKKVSG